jgi:putative transcriptional regulator
MEETYGRRDLSTKGESASPVGPRRRTTGDDVRSALWYAAVVSITAIEPGLLLAAPSLGDPNFEGTVVLLGVHGPEGSLGWIVNGTVIDDATAIVRATGLVDASAQLPEGFSRPAVRGGPVAPETVWILYVREGDGLLPGSIPIGDQVAVTATPDALRTLIAGEGPSAFRLVIGYAGWAPGQLDREVGSGVWLPAKVTVDLVFEGDSATLWRRAYAEEIGASPAAFVTTTRGSA